MHVEMRPLGSIRPYENNPRFNDAAVDAVAASIRAFGFRQPLVVDEAGVIIVGHTRYKAALKLGLKEVPVHVAVGLSPAQAKAYRLADNQTTELSWWDDDKLAQELGKGKPPDPAVVRAWSGRPSERCVMLTALASAKCKPTRSKASGRACDTSCAPSVA